MTEAAFARTFLGTIDSRPVRLSADHAEDPKSFPARAPYILARMPTPMSKPDSKLPGQERSVTVVIKSLRNPPLDIKLTSQPLNTSILDLKNSVTAQTRVPVDKLKLLYNKRPVGDSKVIKEVIGEADTKIEFAVMVVGGAAAIPAEQSSATPETPSVGTTELETEDFWSDLKGFLMQRLKDESQAEDLSRLFKTSWESSKSRP